MQYSYVDVPCCKSRKKAELQQYWTKVVFMSVRHKISISKIPPVLFLWRLYAFHLCYRGNFPRKTLYVKLPIGEMLFISRNIFRLKHTGVVNLSRKKTSCLYRKTDNSVKEKPGLAWLFRNMWSELLNSLKQWWVRSGTGN
jgi:hypothetical protein